MTEVPCRGTAFRRFASASSTHSSNRASSKGLLKKSTAPAFIARSRTRSCGNAVMKMIGVVWPLVTKKSCNSTPFIPGISTSAMTQEVSFNWGEDKNSWAEANAYAEKPIDLNNRAVAVRTEGSSSTIEMTGTTGTRPDLFSRAEAGPVIVASHNLGGQL
jgi:hypothetical protein